MKTPAKMLFLAALAGIGMIAAPSARANSITLNLEGGPTGATQVGANFEYVYDVQLTQGSAAYDPTGSSYGILGADSGVTLNLFADLVGSASYSATVAGTDFNISYSTPVTVGANTYQDIVLAYSGSEVNNDSGNMITLGKLTLDSTAPSGFVYTTKSTDYVSNGTSTPTTELPDAPDTTFGPTVISFAQATAPVPASAWGGLGLLGAFAAFRLRKAGVRKA